MISCAALEASLDAILALGVPAIFDHVTRYLDELQLGLEARGLDHVRAEHAGGRSGILSLRIPEPHGLAEVAAELGIRGIACSTRTDC
jgi:selenocysteine lyase/cysteine desulfurase